MNAERCWQHWQHWRRLNRALALATGAGLLAVAAWVLADIVARRLGHSLGGSEEISGYAMALLSAWGMSYALTERCHVRIELLRQSLPGAGRALLDLFAGLALALVVSAVAWRAWPVLARSWRNGSSSNTSLEVPLWAVQLPWWLGWLWFALSAWLALAVALVLWRDERRETVIGPASTAGDGRPGVLH